MSGFGDDRHKSRAPRKYDSGAQKRKRSKEKDERHKAVVDKTQKISEFFTPAQTGDSSMTEAGTPTETEQADLATQPPRQDSPNISEGSTDEEHASDEEARDILTDRGPGFANCIGCWPPERPSSEMIDYWASRDLEPLQNSTGPFDSSIQFVEGRKRCCSKNLFYRRLQNGESVKRSWLCFSTSTGKLYCIACKLFGGATALGGEGFNDWKHASRSIEVHERSHVHCANIIRLSDRATSAGRVDTELVKQVSEIASYWREVLKRSVSVISFLAERGLAFRGSDEIVGSRTNGNYLGLMELLAEYDPFLAQHIQKYANQGSGHTNYLSSTTCEELVSIIGKSVLDNIVARVKEAKYFSVSVDSTPDISHIDQLTVILRYIENEAPVERFMTFLSNTGHTGLQQATALLDFLKATGLDIANCRGQSYDNASNMSGRYNGMQGMIKQENPLAIFVPCVTHSLNLVGQSAVGCCRPAAAFFEFVEQVYVFFTASTSRYARLFDALKAKGLQVPKRLSDTRWSAHSDATRALVDGYSEIMDVLDEIANDEQLNSETRNTAETLHQTMCTLEIGFYAGFWSTVLGRFDRTSKTLQSQATDLNTAVQLLKSLASFVQSLRDQFDTFVVDGVERSGTEEFTRGSRRRKRNVRLAPLDYGHTPEVELDAKESFRISGYVAVIDVLLSQLEKRTNAYSEMSDRFGFLRALVQLEVEQIRESCSKLVELYREDLSPDLTEEMIQFQAMMKESEPDSGRTELEMYSFLIERKLTDTFPNVEVLLRIYLSLMVSNCSGERSFSKLKLIKNHLRSTMGQQRLVNLTIISTESDVLNSMQVDSIISEFAAAKSRRKLVH